jgi:RHS repeat-associated protein
LPGQYFDVESGWNHNGFRDYAPQLGRYIEPDPLGRLGSGNNLYAYVGDNPINFTDPFGLCPDGMHEATPDELSKILAAANQIAGQGLKYSNIKCNQFVDKAINQAFPGTTKYATSTSGIGGGLGPFQETNSPAVGDIALLNSPGHVVLITGVSSGRVTSFIGSQTSSGPAPVTLPNTYWGGRFSQPGNVRYYQICLPN